MELPENVIEFEVHDGLCTGCINLKLEIPECIDLPYNKSEISGMHCVDSGIIYVKED